MYGTPLETVGQMGGWGVVMVGVFLMSFGKLIPSRTHDEIVRGLVKQVDEWRTLALKADDRVDDLLPTARVATESLRALSEASGKFSTDITQAMAGKEPAREEGR